MVGGDEGDFLYVNVGDLSRDEAGSLRWMWEMFVAEHPQQFRCVIPPRRVGAFSQDGPAPANLPGYC